MYRQEQNAAIEYLSTGATFHSVPTHLKPELFRPEAWTQYAECVDEWELFDAEPFTPEAHIAKLVCQTCPVIAECAKAGEDQAYGVWGGVHKEELDAPEPDQCPAHKHAWPENKVSRSQGPGRPRREACKLCERDKDRAKQRVRRKAAAS
jgi:hypothetical protein